MKIVNICIPWTQGYRQDYGMESEMYDTDKLTSMIQLRSQLTASQIGHDYHRLMYSQATVKLKATLPQSVLLVTNLPNSIHWKQNS